MPKATFYIFPKLNLEIFRDDREFAVNLLKTEGVYIVPGSGFGRLGVGHIRAVTLAPEIMIEEAFQRIESFVKKVVKSKLA